MARWWGVRATIGAGLAVVVAACVPSSPPERLEPTPVPDGVRVMTYNLLGAQADGNVFDEWAGWAARLDQLRPDVVVLQEAQGDDVSAILGRTTTPYALASYRIWECDAKGNPEGVAILVRTSIAVVGSGGTHVGESCVDPGVRRVLVWADLDVGSGSFRVYGSHLTAGGGASAASREAQIRAIKQIIVAADPGDARRWLFAGDVNVTPGSFGYRLLTGAVAAEPGPYRFIDTVGDDHPNAVDPVVCPTVPADPTSMATLLANPAHVRDCGYTSGWPKDDNLLGCDLLSLCTSWEQRRDLSVRERIDVVLRPEGGPVTVTSTFVPNRTDADWAATGSEWFRLSDHLPYVVDVRVE